ncbi:hypothetical protein Afil01_16400 [Actinorhabdospora filicis]|uniref:HTH luxR-type domain-containing protein n=1 Tax=Actinorhabdospora filicis TaxID=1785913 RepID=A0A9W6SID5_9ACTN|nr:helix-turn-helix transcriptional regulator [Actinorhabdospora filicis]GLZ76833.1 hypothetical protein Afil01_16400 [Actinorhabdospora filicis]
MSADPGLYGNLHEHREMHRDNRIRPENSRPRTRRGPDRLNERQTHIVTLLAEGASDVQIARRLYIGQRTVQREVASLMSQVGAASRFALGAEAALRGWL